MGNSSSAEKQVLLSQDYRESVKEHSQCDIDDSRVGGGGNCDGGRRYFAEVMSERDQTNSRYHSDDGDLFEGGGNCDGGRRYYKELMKARAGTR